MREGISQEARAVTEEWRTSPVLSKLFRRVQDAEAFLRMAAIELRRIAEQAPDIAAELRHVAQQAEAEAEDLARHAEAGPDPDTGARS
jgi:hypothetical protein